MATAIAAVSQISPPNQSLYIQNLPDKLHKDDLRRSLYTLFSTYGPVLDVTAMKTQKMRGQAHVLFRDTQSATQALRNCQGFDFFGREMKIAYSKNRSSTLAKLTGTVNQPSTTTQTTIQQAQAPASFAPLPGTGPPAGLGPPPSLPAKIVNGAGPATAPQDVDSPQGVKRHREESEGEDGDEGAPMDEEEEDEEGAMEMSDEEE